MNKQQIQEHIQRVKRERAVTVTAPSRLQYRVVRASMNIYLEGGRLPENFVILMRRAAAKEITQEQALEQLKPEDAIAYEKFLAQLVQQCVVEPRIVTRPAQNDDEIDLGDLALIGDYDFLALYIAGLAPDQPVQTKEGETSVAALEQFRNEPEGSVPAESGSDGAQIQPTPV